MPPASFFCRKVFAKNLVTVFRMSCRTSTKEKFARDRGLGGLCTRPSARLALRLRQIPLRNPLPESARWFSSRKGEATNSGFRVCIANRSRVCTLQKLAGWSGLPFAFVVGGKLNGKVVQYPRHAAVHLHPDAL